MARSRRSPAVPNTHPDPLKRAARLCRLIRLMTGKGATRALLIQRLRLDIRTFYRDLETVRSLGVAFELSAGKYVLQEDTGEAIGKVPFPDPQLTIAEALRLGKGRSAAHRKIKATLGQILPS